MFESKSSFVRVGAYLIIGFFTLIIVIAFGMPDFLSRLNMSDNTAAIVNGEKIQRLDYIRYRDSISKQLSNTDSKEVREMILNNLIVRKLIMQKAKDIGIKVSDAKVMDMVKSFFRDQNGKFNKDYMDRYLAQTHQGLPDFLLMIKEDLIITEFRKMIFFGTGVSPDEVKTNYTIDNSKIQIKYCFLSNEDLTRRYKDKITVNDSEIEQEFKTSKEELKDPVSDRARIKDKIEKRKLNSIKSEIITKINKLAEDKKSFNEAAAYLNGSVFLSNVFKVGETITQDNKKDKVLFSISNSVIFADSFLNMDIGNTSKVIDSYDGLFIFTPVRKEFSMKETPPKDYEKIEKDLVYQRNNNAFSSIMESVREKAKITRNLKFD